MCSVLELLRLYLVTLVIAMAMVREGVVVPEPSWMREGNMAEYRAEEAGYEGSWFAVKIVKLHYKSSGERKVCHQVYVQYRDFTVSDDPGSEPLHEFVMKDQLRPFPPELQQTRWRVRDAVETMHNDAWWVGFIKYHNSKENTYRVYYGVGQAELDLPHSHIRCRLEYVRPSGSDLRWSWRRVCPMQDPPAWGPRVNKRELQTQSRLKVSPRRLVYDSDHSWDEDKGRRRGRQPTKRPRLQRKSVSGKPRARTRIRVIKFPKPGMEITTTNLPPHPPKVSEQSIVCLTPGSSPPADSPPHDSNITRASDPQSQIALATTELSPQRRPLSATSSSSSTSSSNNSGSSSKSSSEDVDADGDNSEEDESVHTRTHNRGTVSKGLPDFSIFTDFSADRVIEDRAAYKKLLERFRDSSKGVLDKRRHELLQGIRHELQLPLEFCWQAHCEVFGVLE